MCYFPSTSLAMPHHALPGHPDPMYIYVAQRTTTLSTVTRKSNIKCVRTIIKKASYSPHITLFLPKQSSLRF